MSVVLLVRDRGGASYVTPQRIRVRDRVAARLRAARLDAELAQGVAPQSSAELELRAQALIGPVARKLGIRLRQILLSAQSAGAMPAGMIPICGGLVREAQPELSLLLGRLLGGGPVDPRGVATVGLCCATAADRSTAASATPGHCGRHSAQQLEDLEVEA
jgi:hypothetical protein